MSTTNGSDGRDPELWEAAGLLSWSTQRTRDVDPLAEGEATPKGLAECADMTISHVSRCLRELPEVGAVELLVSEDTHKGRVHGLTERGRRAAEKVEEVDA
jgi:hypothetical protein